MCSGRKRCLQGLIGRNAHIYASIWFEDDALGTQQLWLFGPSRSCSAGCIDYPVARQMQSWRSFAECPAHHARMLRPTGQPCQFAVGDDAPCRYLCYHIIYVAVKIVVLRSWHKFVGFVTYKDITFIGYSPNYHLFLMCFAARPWQCCCKA